MARRTQPGRFAEPAWAGYVRRPAVLRKFRVQWYTRFKSNENKEGSSAVPDSSPALLDALRGRESSAGLYVAYVDGSGEDAKYYYAWFSLYLEFYEVYRTLGPQERSFHEVVRGSDWQKARWDLDMPLTPGMPSDLDQKVLDATLNALEDVLAERDVDFDPGRDIFHTTAHSATKRSHHLILASRVCAHHEEARALDAAVRARVPAELRAYLDPNVNKSLQLFRMLDSGKPDVDHLVRHKTWAPTWRWNGRAVICRIGEDALSRFEASLLTVCQGQDLLPPFVLARATYSDHTISEQTAQAAATLFQKHKTGLAVLFNVGEVSDHHIRLERIQAGHCPICGRTHDNENASLYVSLETGGYGAVSTAGASKRGAHGVYFNCFRRDREETKMLRLGSLPLDGPPEEENEKIGAKPPPEERAGLVGFGLRRPQFAAGGLAVSQSALPAETKEPSETQTEKPTTTPLMTLPDEEIDQALVRLLQRQRAPVVLPKFTGGRNIRR